MFARPSLALGRVILPFFAVRADRTRNVHFALFDPTGGSSGPPHHVDLDVADADIPTWLASIFKPGPATTSDQRSQLFARGLELILTKARSSTGRTLLDQLDSIVAEAASFARSMTVTSSSS